MREFRYNNFDVIRLFAAVQVVVVHAVAHLEVDPTGTVVKWLRLFPGVPIFFVISGFLISSSFERSNCLRTYFVNRALRIFPALWLCLIVSVSMAWSIERFSLTSGQFFLWLGTQVSFLQFYHPEFLRGFGVGVLNGSLWTIPVELQFYALLPALIIFLRYFDWRWVVWVPLLLLMVAFNRFQAYEIHESGQIGKLLHVSILPHFYMFFVGVLLQKYFHRVVDLASRYLVMSLAVYLTVAYICEKIGIGYAGSSINPVSAILLGILVVGAGYAMVPKQPLCRGIDISYGVYIYHMPFVNLMLEYEGSSSLERFIWVLCLTLFAATVSWFMVEKPALSLKPAFKR